jgi:hypothetical protein
MDEHTVAARRPHDSRPGLLGELIHAATAIPPRAMLWHPPGHAMCVTGDACTRRVLR